MLGNDSSFPARLSVFVKRRLDLYLTWQASSDVDPGSAVVLVFALDLCDGHT